jgi:hypothetical protein
MTKAEQARRTMERRQKIINFTKVPRTSVEIVDYMNFSKFSIHDDMKFLRNNGIMSLYSGIPKAHGLETAKYVCKQLNILANGFSANMKEYPPILQQMLGFNQLEPQGAQAVRNLDKPYKSEPLRKMNYAWQGYQSGLEAA